MRLAVRADKSRLEELKAMRAERFELMEALAELPDDMVFFTQITMEAAEDPDFLAAMKKGNFLGLPVNFLVFSIVTVIVTSGTLKVFGEAIMDPVLIVERIGHPVVVIIGSLTFIVATMGINIVANFVSPAYDIANLWPEKISFRWSSR